jgi:prephenate dehydrogenase
LIGGSLGLAVRRARPELEVLGIAVREQDAAAAVKLGAITAGGVDLQLAVATDLVVIATPLQEMRLVLARLGRLTTASSTLITDVGSTKAAVCEWAAELLGDRGRFLGGHPMTGKTETGLKAADGNLFKGSPWIFTPNEAQDLAPFQPWMELVDTIGAKRIVMTPDEHDRRVALVSHLAFVASAAYVATVKASPEWAEAVRIAGPGFRDMTRLAGGDPDLYTGIARTNRTHLLAAVQGLEAELTKFRRHLEADDSRIWELFEETRRVHDQWMR